MSQLRHFEEQISAHDLRIKVITFDSQWMAEAYVKETELNWPLLMDSDRSLYQRYGLSRGSWFAIYGVSSIWKYIKLIAGGRRPGKPGKDWRQLGGDILIDPAGYIRLFHASESPHDRPSPESIFELIESQGT